MNGRAATGTRTTEALRSLSNQLHDHSSHMFLDPPIPGIDGFVGELLGRPETNYDVSITAGILGEAATGGYQVNQLSIVAFDPHGRKVGPTYVEVAYVDNPPMLMKYVMSLDYVGIGRFESIRPLTDTESKALALDLYGAVKAARERPSLLHRLATELMRRW